MSNVGFLSSLNLLTLVIVLAIAAAALLWFLRKRSNAQPLEGRQERNVARDLDAERPAPRHSPPD